MTVGCRAVWETGVAPTVAALARASCGRAALPLVLPVRRAHMRYAWILPVMWLGAFLLLLGVLRNGGVLESLEMHAPTSSISVDYPAP